LLLVSCSLIIGLTGPADAVISDLDVDRINIVQYKEFWDGTVETNPFGFKVWGVLGGNVTSVSMVDPHGDNHALSYGDFGFGGGGQAWGFEDDGFADLTSLDASFGPGNYVFTFNGGEDTVTIDYQYTQPSGPVNITYPANLQSNVPLDPTFTWDSALGLGLFQVAWLTEDPDGLDNIVDQVELFTTFNSWQPDPPLTPLTAHDFEISILTFHGNMMNNLQTDLRDDDFYYLGMFEYSNGVGFTTVPEPTTLGLLLIGGLAMLRRRFQKG
jgi:hypothetical protein